MRGSRTRSTTSSPAGSTRRRNARAGRWSMRELVEELFADEDAWIVGGAVRDELLGREIVDLDVALREPERAARRYARRSEGAPFPLSERHGAWRVALDGGRARDFTPLPGGSIESDLRGGGLPIQAVAAPRGGGGGVGPLPRPAPPPRGP